MHGCMSEKKRREYELQQLPYIIIREGDEEKAKTHLSLCVKSPFYFSLTAPSLLIPLCFSACP